MYREGEAPAEPKPFRNIRLGRSLALPFAPTVPLSCPTLSDHGRKMVIFMSLTLEYQYPLGARLLGIS